LRWSGGIDAKSSAFGPGRHYKDIAVSLVAQWKDKNGKPPSLPPGKHKVRVLFRPEPPERAGGGDQAREEDKPLRVESNEVEIEIATKGSPEAKNDLQKLQGAWLCRWREYDGKKHAGEDETWTFDGNMVSMMAPAGISGIAPTPFTLDETKEPRRLTIKVKAANNETIIPCLYKLDGNTLTICYHDGKDAKVLGNGKLLKKQPTEFIAKPGTGMIVLTFDAAKAAWGQTVEGVRCRLISDQVVWKAGEIPTFKGQVNNQSKQDLADVGLEQFCEIEFDSKVFTWSGGIDAGIPTLPAGRRSGDIPISLGGNWKDKQGKQVDLSAGKHKLRVIFLPRLLGTDKRPRVPTNEVEIEIRPRG
jgi:uncharacterized protein (TIGR03067 family)